MKRQLCSTWFYDLPKHLTSLIKIYFHPFIMFEEQVNESNPANNHKTIIMVSVFWLFYKCIWNATCILCMGNSADRLIIRCFCMYMYDHHLVLNVRSIHLKGIDILSRCFRDVISHDMVLLLIVCKYLHKTVFSICITMIILTQCVFR